MFADYIKWGVRMVAIAAGIGLVVAFIHNFYFPDFDLTLLNTAIGKGKAILSYYVGPFVPLLQAGVALLLIKFVLLPTIRISILATRSILAINK